MKGFFKDSSFAGRLFQFLFIFYFCLLGGIVFGTFISSGSADDNFSMKILTMIQSISSFLIPSFVLAYLWSEKPFYFLYLKTKSDGKAFFLVILMMIAVIPFINLLADLNQKIVFPGFMSELEEQMKAMEERAATQTANLLTAHTIAGLFFNIFLVAVIPALGEELFFRGTLQRLISDAKGAVLAIWVVAFVFSAIHMQFYGFIPRLLLGAFFGYLLVWSKNMWLPIVAHFVNNAIAVILYYLSDKICLKIDLDTIGAGNTWWLGIVSGLVSICGFYLLKKYFAEKNKLKL